MATFKQTTVPPKRLNIGINAAAASFQLDNILGWNGIELAASDFGTYGWAVFLNEAKTLMEITRFDPATVASDSISFVKRGLDYGGSDTEVTANKQEWNAGETIVLLGTNPPQIYEQLVDLVSAQDIEGLKTFAIAARPRVSLDMDATDDTEFVTKGQLSRTSLGTTLNNRQVMSGTAGETLAIGNLVYFKESDQRWWKADADALATAQNVTLGIAQTVATAGNAVNILLNGIDINQTGMTPGAKYYVSGTAGAISASLTSIPRLIGRAVSATILMFQPDSLDANIIPAVSGGALAVGDLVYFKESDQRWYQTDADAAGTCLGVRLGIVQTVTSAIDQLVLVRVQGVDFTRTGLTAGSKYYVSNTAGAITLTAPTLPRFVGYAIGTVQFLFIGDDVKNVDVYGQNTYAATSSGNDTYVVTLPFAPVAYYAGFALNVKIDVTNTGPATINVNGLGAKNIVKPDGSALGDAQMPAGGVARLIYDGTNMQILNPVYYQLFQFTASGAFVAPRGVTSVLVDIVAGGGGGGGANNVDDAGGGGGGGDGASNVSSVVVPYTAYAVVVGAGGAGGNTGPTQGGNGGTSSFNGISKTGGTGGAASGTGTGGAAGGAGAGAGGNGGQNNAAGTAGGAGTYGAGGAGIAAAGGNSGSGGGGGGAFGAGAAGVVGIGSAGVAGSRGGGGGSGGSNQGAGGAGGDGFVIIKVPINQIV